MTQDERLLARATPLETFGIQAADLVRPDLVAQFGIPPFRIDILTGVSGVTFDDAWPNRIQADFEGVRVPVLGRAELIRNKLASGRKKDLADIESLGDGSRS